MKNDIIKIIREHLSLNKIDVYESTFDKRTYNKYEKDILPVSLIHIFELCDRFGISFEELFDIANITTDNTTEVDILRTSVAKALNESDSIACYEIFKKVKHNRFRNPKYLSLYIVLKNFGRKVNKLIPKLSNEDVTEIYTYYENRLVGNPYLFSQDYNVMTNLVPELTFKQLKKFEFFFLDETLCLTNLRKAKEVAVLSYIGNYLDRCLQTANFTTAMRIIQFYRKTFKSEESNSPTTSRHLWIETLELLLLYKESKELKYFINATSMLEVIKIMNETFILKSLTDEINKIMNNSDYKPSLDYYNLYLGEHTQSVIIQPKKETDINE